MIFAPSEKIIHEECTCIHSQVQTPENRNFLGLRHFFVFKNYEFSKKSWRGGHTWKSLGVNLLPPQPMWMYGHMWKNFVATSSLLRETLSKYKWKCKKKTWKTFRFSLATHSLFILIVGRRIVCNFSTRTRLTGRFFLYTTWSNLISLFSRCI